MYRVSWVQHPDSYTEDDFRDILSMTYGPYENSYVRPERLTLVWKDFKAIFVWRPAQQTVEELSVADPQKRVLEVTYHALTPEGELWLMVNGPQWAKHEQT